MDTHTYPLGTMTVEEYLRFEEASPERHEYVAGQVYAMSGVTMRHHRIVTNLYDCLRAATRSSACDIALGDVKVRVAEERFYYPDVAVVCPKVDQKTLVLRDPCLIVEVTSPSTRRTDRSEKLDAYQRVSGVQSYLIVEQGERLVERHWRDADGTWRHETVTSGDITVSRPPATLPLDAIYDGIELDPPPRRLRRVRERRRAV